MLNKDDDDDDVHAMMMKSYGLDDGLCLLNVVSPAATTQHIL